MRSALEELELYCTELEDNKFQAIQIDEESKEFKLFETEGVNEDLYTYVSPNTMNRTTEEIRKPNHVESRYSNALKFHNLQN